MVRKKNENVSLQVMPDNVRLPAALEIEQSVLCAMMIEKEAVAKAVEMLTPATFYSPKHKLIFEAMRRLFDAGEPIDTITLYEELKRNGQAEQVGGAVYLSNLSQNISSAANIEYHAKIILEKSILRNLISTSHDIAKSAYAENEDAFEILDSAEKKIFEITEQHLKRSFTDMKRAVQDALEYIEAIHGKDYNKFAVSSGFYDLDAILGGFQKSDLIILAARPSMGKTALALSFATNAALTSKIPVAIFSLEMATIQLVIRLICSEGKFNAHRIRTGKLGGEEGRHLGLTATKLVNAPIYIDDSPAQSILEIRAKARRLKSEKRIGLIVIDYLQLIQANIRTESREREIAHISRSLKALAKELDIPVVALAQLNRSVEGRADKKPQLADLRESGSIEQDADVVMFINRPEFYKIGEFDDGMSTEGIAEIIIAKQRNGPTGDVRLVFLKDHARFENLEKYRKFDEVSIPKLDTEDIM